MNDVTNDVREFLCAIISALDVRRNRFGKLDGDFASAEPVRQLLIRYRERGWITEAGGDVDVIAQIVKVAKALLIKGLV